MFNINNASKRTPLLYKQGTISESDEFYERNIKPRLFHLAAFLGDSERSEEEICDYLGIEIEDLNTYKLKYPAFKQAIDNGNEYLIMSSVGTLCKVSKGFHYEEVEDIVTTAPSADDPDKYIVLNKKRRVSKKYRPPDTNALMFILLNKSNDWSKSGNIVQSSNNNVIVNIPQEQLDATKDRLETLLNDSNMITLGDSNENR